MAENFYYVEQELEYVDVGDESGRCMIPVAEIQEEKIIYKADTNGCELKWRSPVTMPQELARTFVKVTSCSVNQVEGVWLFTYGIKLTERQEQ